MLLIYFKVLSSMERQFDVIFISAVQCLQELNIQRLSERRDMLRLKFAKKSLKVDNFKHLFPINSKQHKM